VGVDVGEGDGEGVGVPSATVEDDAVVSGNMLELLLQAAATDTVATMPVNVRKISSLSARISTPQFCLQLIFIISLFLL
jgi:hypothetical protein